MAMIFSARPLIRHAVANSNFQLFALSFLLLFSALAVAEANAPGQPVAAVKPVTDTYFGQSVTDPYRWMENLPSPEVQSWMKAQSVYTKDYLSHLPGRDALIKRIESLDNASTKVSSVEHRGANYFYLKTRPEDQTPRLYVRSGMDGAERLLADAQVVGGGKQRYTISSFYPSKDGKFVAVEVAAGGSEEGVVRVIEAATGKVLPDSIDRVWESSAQWNEGDKSFFYTRLQKLGPGKTDNDKELDSTAYLHRLGDSADKDVAVLSRVGNPDLGMIPTDSPGVLASPGSPYVIGVIEHGVQNELTLMLSPAKDAVEGTPHWKKFVDVADDVTDLAVKGHEIWLLSHKDASRYKVLHLDLNHPDIATAEVAVPMSDLVLQGVACAGDAVYIGAGRAGISQILRVGYGNKTAERLPLPYVGSFEDISVDVLQPGVLFRYAGWTHAPQWYGYNVAGDSKISMTHLEPMNPTDFSGITSEEVTAPAADGTPVPLSIIYKKGLKMDGKNPCLMEGYGSYGISIDPYFDARALAQLEKGIVIAFAHVRGGGENGEDWHIAGQKLTKENTISDFIACEQYLETKGYTSPAYLAGKGTSAGGITIGGALTQRPDLMTLAICNVGSMNATRAEFSPNGPSNTPEFGTVKEADGFKALYQMDAYLHVKDGTKYPTVLLITGANDPRVSPWELLKMTARLQAATTSGNPVLLRVDYDAGHGIGSSKTQRDVLMGDQTALLLNCAGKQAQPVQ